MTPPVPDPAVRREDGDAPLRVAMIGLRGIPATYGGVERAVQELSIQLADRGHEVVVYARSAYSDPGRRSYRGVRILRLPQINTKHLEAVSHTLLALGHALLAGRYDVIHLHATGPGATAPLVRLARVPVVVTVQGLDFKREKWGGGARKVLRLAARLAVAAPDRAIVVSRELQRHYRDSLGVETTYIPNGFQIDEPPTASPFAQLEPDGYYLFLGRLVPEKHVDTLIRAYRQVPGDRPLVIAGPDSHSPEYVAELHRLAGEDPRVWLAGPRYGEEKSWLMAHARVFVQPSSIEGLPIALLEALSHARLPVVSEIPENTEPVTVDGELLGRSFPVGDERALAAALVAAAQDERRLADGARLAEHVRRHYDWAQIARDTETVYREIRRARTPGRPSENPDHLHTAEAERQ